MLTVLVIISKYSCLPEAINPFRPQCFGFMAVIKQLHVRANIPTV